MNYVFRILWMALFLFSSALWAQEMPAVSPMEEAVQSLQQEWAEVNYQTPDPKQQGARIEALAARAGAVSAEYSHDAEPLIWQAIILSTQAKIQGGLHALSQVKEARRLLLKAETLNPLALEGSIYTSLGSLYYKVPSWPVAFGDDALAHRYLEQALSMNPDGIDPNFFYGDLLVKEKKYSEARKVLAHALDASPRPGREVADRGRRAEIQALLSRIEGKS